MLYEYAVEPETIAKNWDTCRYLAEKFGYDRGRLLSLFPKKWLRLADDSAMNLRPIERHKIVEKLRELKNHASIKSNRPYDNRIDSWLENALLQHQNDPFHAIIAATNPRNENFVLPANDLDENHPLMAVPHECRVKRDIDSLSAALRQLLRIGSRLVFVDPFFDPFKTNYKRIFFRCLSIVKSMNPKADCEIHYRYSDDRKLTNVELERNANTLFKDVVPEGMSVRIFCWREKEGGEDFHARFLLTDRGGIRLDAGFDPTGDHQTTDLVLMNINLCQKRLNDIKKDTLIYELIEPVIKVSSDGIVPHT